MADRSATMTTSDKVMEYYRMKEEIGRLRAALELIAAVRGVSGSAHAAFRSNLRIADAALKGADTRVLSVVEAIEKGTWKP